ncbi:MAG: hypothetical protein IKN31_00345 [Bacteroidales bacterium]|nr:hypothetical protein [Bacteroidales bacterium]
MKPTRLFTVAAVAILAIGCSAPDNNTSDDSIRKFVFNLEDFEPDLTTKTTTVISGSSLSSLWNEGDKIGVFPDLGGDQVSFTVSEGRVPAVVHLTATAGRWCLRPSIPLTTPSVPATTAMPTPSRA